MSSQRILFDHVAIGLARLEDATPFVVGELGARSHGGDVTPTFAFWQWELEGGGRLEILEPAGPPGGFLYRFLEQRGPGIHHVTFKVGDLERVCRRAEALGYTIVGFDDFDPGWREAFLHPKEAMGIVVQMAESRPERRAGGAQGAAEAAARQVVDEAQLAEPVAPPRPAHAVTLVGLRLAARDRARVHAQWGELLEGELEEAAGLLVYRWPESPLRLAVELRPEGTEGPVAIELSDLGGLGLPREPRLGARWLEIRAEPATAGAVTHPAGSAGRGAR